MNIDCSLSEERKNIFSYLGLVASKCSSKNYDGKRAFSLLYNVWEKTSWQLWSLCYWDDYLRCGHLVLKAARNINNIQVEAQLLSEMGWTYMEAEDLENAREYFKESLEKYRVIKDYFGECRLLRYLGVLAHRERRLDDAIAYYRQVGEIISDRHRQGLIDDRSLFYQAELPNVIGCVYLEMKDFPASDRQFNLSLKNYEILLEKYPDLRDEYRYYLANPLLNLGRWHFLKGNYKDARNKYQECLEFCREIKRTDTMAGVLLRLAELAEAEGNFKEAIDWATEAENIAGTEIRKERDRAAILKEKLLLKLSLNDKNYGKKH